MPSNANFIQERIAGEILRQMRMRLVTGSIVNRNYEGEVTSPEDTVRILKLANLTVRDYSKGTAMTVETDLQSDDVSLAMDHKKYFAFIADETDNAAQVAELFSQEGVQDLLKEAQQYVLGQYGDSSSFIEYDPAADDVEKAVGAARTALDNNEVPDAGRFIVVDPDTFGSIEDDVSGRETAFGDNVLRVGFQGLYKGFEVYKAPQSHFTTTATGLHALAGSRLAITYADAILDVRVNPSLDYRGNQIDGLHVGGAKVVRPDALIDFRIAQP
jgi:hypothetical protein